MRATTMKLNISYDISDLIFRVLFSLIFLGLGMEHFFSDHLIQAMMPDWLGGSKRLVSIVTGAILLSGGVSILIGWKVQTSAVLLGIFLLVVTVAIHGPALLHHPTDMPPDWTWVWDVYQRSNFFKNLCLLGVCFHLNHHRVGRFGMDGRKER